MLHKKTFLICVTLCTASLFIHISVSNAQKKQVVAAKSSVTKKGTFIYPDNFREGLALIIVGDKYGFINRTGSYVYPPVLDAAEPIIDGYSRVTIGNKMGIIDRSG